MISDLVEAMSAGVETVPVQHPLVIKRHQQIMSSSSVVGVSVDDPSTNNDALSAGVEAMGIAVLSASLESIPASSDATTMAWRVRWLLTLNHL